MQSFQRITKLFFSAWLPLLVFASCAKDRWGDGSNGTGQDTSRNNYVVFFDIRTLDNAATRASSSDIEEAGNGDLVYGSENEHAIGRGNYAFFFDKSDILMTISDIYLDNEQHNTDDSEEVKNNDGSIKENIEARYEARFEVDRENLPHSCLLLLNGLRFQDELEAIRDAIESGSRRYKIDDILALMDNENPLWIGRDGDDHEYFTMTNSVYEKNGTLQAVTLIPESFIQNTKTYDPKKVLTVYVERMVAKFSFSIDDHNTADPTIFQPSTNPDIIMFDGFNDNGSPIYSAKKWCIKVTGWNINALEGNSYLFKQIPSSVHFSGWNDETNYRSYWAKDNTYDDENYPWQYRSGGYNRQIPYYAPESPAVITRLNNYSYSDLELGAADDKHFTRPLYRPESTFDPDAVAEKHDDRDELLCASHLIVGAELRIKTESDNDSGINSGVENFTNYEAVDLFRDRNGLHYLYERDCFMALIHAFNQLLTSQKTMNFVYYDWNGKGGDGNGTVTRTIKTTVVNGVSGESDSQTPLYQIYWDQGTGEYIPLNDEFFDSEKGTCKNAEDFKKLFGGLVIAEIPRGDGQRLPWPEKGKLSIRTSDGNPVCIYELDDVMAGFETVLGEKLRNVEDDENDMKSLLYEWLGEIDHFNDGRMYYAHGIENPPFTDGQKSIFGTVRNNWYQFKLKDIASLGVPVDDPKQPIVPDYANTHDKLNVTIYILDWHTESTTTPVVGTYN